MCTVVKALVAVRDICVFTPWSICRGKVSFLEFSRIRAEHEERTEEFYSLCEDVSDYFTLTGQITQLVGIFLSSSRFQNSITDFITWRRKTLEIPRSAKRRVPQKVFTNASALLLWKKWTRNQASGGIFGNYRQFFRGFPGQDASPDVIATRV